MLDRNLVQSCLNGFRFSHLPATGFYLPKTLFGDKRIILSNRIQKRLRCLSLNPCYRKIFCFAGSSAGSDSEMEIIFTGEHPDGSLLFKFGVPEKNTKKPLTGVNVDSVADSSEAMAITDTISKRGKKTDCDDETVQHEPNSRNRDVSDANALETGSTEMETADQDKRFARQLCEDGLIAVETEKESVETSGKGFSESSVTSIAKQSSEANSEQITEIGVVPKTNHFQNKSKEATNQDRMEVNPPEESMLCLVSGFALLPHPRKASTGGEDAFFVSGKNWIGVADGVGQWACEGINSGIFAQELMENCRKIVSSQISSLDPKQVLLKSAMESTSAGSSTAVIASLTNEILHVVNFGDSGFLIIRGGSVLVKSTPMTHGFNFPYQIESGDNPSSLAETYKIDLKEADVIVMGTDGLFDNLYNHEIVSIVESSLQSDLQPKETAELLAQEARKRGKSKSGSTPFADAAHAAGYTSFHGGKLDDITVIVSIVKCNAK